MYDVGMAEIYRPRLKISQKKNNFALIWRKLYPKLKNMLKKFSICITMLGIVVLALASSGGGRKKSSNPSLPFNSFRSSTGFNFTSKPDYTGSMVFGSTMNKNYTMVNSVITYQKGKIIYVVPSKYKITTASRMSFKSNLNVIDLKVRLSK